MKNQKFVTIDIETEDNIGVIALGEVDLKNFRLSTENESKVVQALAEHFDYQIKIRSVEVKRVHPIQVEVIVIVCSDEEDFQETVMLNETWMY